MGHLLWLTHWILYCLLAVQCCYILTLLPVCVSSSFLRLSLSKNSCRVRAYLVKGFHLSASSQESFLAFGGFQSLLNIFFLCSATEAFTSMIPPPSHLSGIFCPVTRCYLIDSSVYRDTISRLRRSHFPTFRSDLLLILLMLRLRQFYHVRHYFIRTSAELTFYFLRS